MDMAVADLTLEGLVHDLNNVFQTISESAELLEDDPKWEKLAHTLRRSADRGHRIAHSILETNRSPIELAPIIENASQFCQDYLECANRPKLEFSSEIDTDFRLKGDAAGWERVFVNLFLNSAQADARTARLSIARVFASGSRIMPRLLRETRFDHLYCNTVQMYRLIGDSNPRRVAGQESGVDRDSALTGGSERD